MNEGQDPVEDASPWSGAGAPAWLLLVTEDDAFETSVRSLGGPDHVDLRVLDVAPKELEPALTERYGEGRASSPVLVLLDADSVEDDAVPLLHRIKQAPVSRRAPVSVIVEDPDDGLVADLYEGHANLVVERPPSREETHEVLAELLHFWIEVAELP